MQSSDIVQLSRSLNENTKSYHKMLLNYYKKVYKAYRKDPHLASNYFLRSLNVPRYIFLDFTESNDLNYGSMGGIILEWTFFYLIKGCLCIENKEDVLKVVDRYQIPFTWKDSGTNVLNVDVALKSAKTTKLYLIMEIKTNFEDGFDKYYEEQSQICHHRKKVYKDFKYHYVSLSNRPPRFYTDDSLKTKVEKLEKQKQLWEFPIAEIDQPDDRMIEKGVMFLKSIYDPIKSIPDKITDKDI
ncbi:MAG: hypothetical protein AB1393_13055 [Candidatus Edwardsbacteria bacterium]